MPREFLFQNGICLCGVTWVSKFFVTHGSVVKKCEVGQNVSLFYSFNDLFREK